MKTQRTSARRVAAFAAACALLVAACGGSGDDQGRDGPDRAPPVPSAVPTTEPPPTVPSTTATSPTTSAVTTTTSNTTTTSVAQLPPAVSTTIAPTCAERLARGCRTDEVRDLQFLLAERGFGEIEIDGIFGPATEAALGQFEAGCDGCVADGEIALDGDEWAALEALDTLSAAFAAVFDAWIGGGDPENTCWWVLTMRDPVDQPTFGFGFDLQDGDATSLIMGLRYEMCLVGFDVTSPVTMTVDGPAGTRSVTVVPTPATETQIDDVFDPTVVGQVEFELVPSDYADVPDYVTTRWERLDDPSLVGPYTITVTQGDVSVSRAVEITSGDFEAPDIRVISADDFGPWQEARPGDTLRMILVGFPPNSRVPLALYGPTGEFGESGAIFEFLGPVESAVVGDQGWAYHEFIVPDLTPNPGVIWDYCIATLESLRNLYCQPYVDAVFDMAQ